MPPCTSHGSPLRATQIALEKDQGEARRVSGALQCLVAGDGSLQRLVGVHEVGHLRSQRLGPGLQLLVLLAQRRHLPVAPLPRAPRRVAIAYSPAHARPPHHAMSWPSVDDILQVVVVKCRITFAFPMLSSETLAPRRKTRSFAGRAAVVRA